MRRTLALLAMSSLFSTVALAASRDSEVVPGSAAELAPRYVMGVQVDYERRFSNGFLEYGFAVPLHMSPSDSNQSAVDLAREFLDVNAELLGIRQNVAAFKYLDLVEFCDATKQVVFEQTYAFVPVRTSRVVVTLFGQRVTYAELRFIPDVTQRLPLCQPDLGNGVAISDIYYMPGPTQNILVVVATDDVIGQVERRVIDACSSPLKTLGFEYVLR